MEQNTQYCIDIFNESDKETKLKLLRRICRQKDNDILQFLVNCLADRDWVIRKFAAGQIKSYGSEAVSSLSLALSSQSEDIQHWALRILGSLGADGIPAILRSMKNSNDEVRFFACNALGEARIPHGVTALIRALGDKKWRVRKAASDALSKYGEAVVAPVQQVLKTTDDEDIKFWAIKTLGRLGPKAQQFLLDALKKGDRNIRYVIAAALGESGDKRVIRVLIESLADPDWTIRKSSTVALAEIGINAIDMMLETLRGTTNEDIRDGCLRALVKTGNPGLTRLFNEIQKMNENYRYLVRKSIVKIGSTVVEPLMRLFKLNNPDLTAFAASTLGEIRNPRAVPILITGLSNPSWTVRRSCAYALTEIGERGVDKIAVALKSSNDDVRYWITRILESTGEPGIPYLVEALKDENSEIRYFSAKALGGAFDSREVVRALIVCLGDKVWSIRKVASESICRIEDLKITDIIRQIASDNENIKYWIKQILKKIGANHIDAITEAMRKGDPELRLHACQAAGFINSSELIPPLIDSLKDDSEWVRTYAAIALGNTGDKRSIIPLIKSFSDRNSTIHANILSALSRLGKDVFKALVECLESDDSNLRKNAAIAAAEMNEDRVLDQIIILMEDPDEKVRQAAAEALGKFSGFKSRTVLKEALSDQSIQVRFAVIKAIGEMNSKEDALTIIDHVSTERDEREMRTGRRVLAKMAESDPNKFIELFGGDKNAVKTIAYDALVAAGLNALPRLTEVAAESKDETVVFWCKKAIKKINEPKEAMFDFWKHS